MRKGLLSIALSIIFLSSLFAQTGSVLLKTGTGTLVSSHNTIQSAYNAITGTIIEGFIIEITTPYTAAEEIFPIQLTAIGDTNQINNIIIRPAAGNTGEVISGSISGTGGTPIILFTGARGVTIDGRPGGVGTAADLKIENTATASTAYTVKFINGASYNKLLYCNTVNYTNGSAGPRNIGFEATPTAANINNLVAYCVIEGGRSTIAFYSSGTGTILSTEGTTIQNCIVKNWGYAGIWFLGYGTNTTVSGCEFFQTIASTSGTQSGLQLSQSGNRGVTLVSKNKFHDLLVTSATGTPRAISGSVDSTGSIKIINNFISMALDNGTAPSVYAIQMQSTASNTVEILYNTIYIGGVHTGGTAGNILSAGIVKTNTGIATNWLQKNNIVVNKRTGGTAGGVHTSSFINNNVGTLDVDYNNYYAAGDPNSFHSGWLGTVYNDLAQYKAAAAPHEQNSKFYNVNFVSATDLHLTGASVGDFQLAGTPITGIATDIDGQTRHAVYPYKGADEGNVALPVELTSFTAAVDKNNVNLYWTTATELNNSGFHIERSSDNSTWKNVAFVQGKGTTTEKTVYAFTDKNVPSGKFTYRLKQVDLNGSSSYHNLSQFVEVIGVNIYSLDQNYPNPFNPTTTISYSVAQSENVSLKIYDITGKEISVLVNEVKEAGTYNVDVNAGIFASGVYFYKLSAGKFTSVKKMTILK